MVLFRLKKMKAKQFFWLFTGVLLVMTLATCDKESVTSISTCALEINVVDTSGRAVPAAEVKGFNTTEFAMATDSIGRCQVSDLFTVTTKVRISKGGYSTIYDEFLPQSGRSTINYTLPPSTAFLDGFESGTLSDEWSNWGFGNWYVTTYYPHSGTYCTHSGNVDNNLYSSLKRTVSVYSDGMTLSFWYRLDTVEYFHFFQFFINDEQMLSQSGYSSWRYFETTLNKGTYELNWKFYKEYSSANRYGVWIDDVQLSE